MESTPSTYLGDGAYAKITHGMLWIYTSDGIRIQNEICLESDGLRQLIKFAQEQGVIS